MKKCILITCALLVLLSFSIFSTDLKIQYRDGDYGNATDNHIKPHLKIVNNDPVSIALKDLTIRYYYSKEEIFSETFHIDYAYIGGNNIIGTFYNDYVEIGFASSAGDIPGGSDSGEIQIRFNKDDWSDYDEINDYSYKNPAISYVNSDKITLYLNGILVCGQEPGGSTPAPQESTPIPLPPEPDPENMPFIESGGMVVLEAENNTGNTPGTGYASYSFWKEISYYIDSSNGEAVVTCPDIGVNVGDTTNGPGLNYDVNFTETGTYYFWVRMWGPYPMSDSLHCGLDGIPASFGASGVTKTSYCWKWVNQAADRVIVNVTTPGLHTINILMREDGTRLDKILLTKDPGYVPTGQGPVESPREASETPEPTPEPTLEPIPGTGNIWLIPENVTVTIGANVVLEVHVNTGNQLLGAYSFTLSYDATIVQIDTSQGISGMIPGDYGFIAAVNALTPGILICSGFDATGTGPSIDLYLAAANFIAIGGGTSPVDLTVDTLVDPQTNIIGIPYASGSVITVQLPATQPPAVTDPPVTTPLPTLAGATVPPETTLAPTIYPSDPPTPVPSSDIIGDVNGDGLVDIIDALLCAQYYIGLNASGFDASNADVNYDGEINIVDALLLAQYYVGVISELPGPDPTIEPDPTPVPETGVGDMWIAPASLMVNAGDTFTTEIHLNSGTQSLAAYGIEIHYDSSMMMVATTAGINGVERGPDGISIMGVNSDTIGILNISALDPLGATPGEDMNILFISWTALSGASGTGTIELIINDLVDVNTDVIGIPGSMGATITITASAVTEIPTVAPTNEPTPPPTLAPTVYYEGVGEVWIVPENITAFSGENVTSEIHVNSGSQRVAAYGLQITYNPSILYYLDASEGADGYITAVNYHNAGTLYASGFDVNGTGPSEDLHLLTITWAASAPGTTVLSLHVSDLVDPGPKIIGNPMGIDAQVTVVVEGVSLKVQYQNGLISDVADMFRPYFNIVNTGTVDIPLSELSIRYYYDRDGAAEEKFSVDYAEVGTEYVLGTITEEYLEVTFSPEAGILATQSETGQIIDSVRRQDGILYDQTNDYSYDPNYPEYADYERVTLHYNGEIIWGIDPASAPPPTTVPTETPTPTPTNVPTETPTPTPDPTPRPTIDGGVPGGPGAVWFEPTDSITAPGGYISIKVYVNTGDQALAAYQLVITFDSSIVKVNTSVWNYGVVEGPDGFVTAVNPDVTGKLTFNGFDISGKGPYPDLCLAIVYFTALQPGVTDLGLTIDDLVDLDYNDIGIPTAYDGTITVSDEIVSPEPTPDLTPGPTLDPTPEPTPTQYSTLDVGTMWIVPEETTINSGMAFVTEIHLNSGNQTLAAYALEIKYDYSVIEPNTDYGSGGIVVGADGFVAAANAAKAGVTYIAGFDVSGKGPGADLHVLDAHWNARNPGTTEITLSVDDLFDVNVNDIGTPRGLGGTVIVQ